MIILLHGISVKKLKVLVDNTRGFRDLIARRMQSGSLIKEKTIFQVPNLH